jgi:hypothetical protein
MMTSRRHRRWAMIASLATGTCFGLGCIQNIAAVIGASFF